MSKGTAWELVLLSCRNSSKKEKLYVLQNCSGQWERLWREGQDCLEIGAGWLRLEREEEPEC